jgi:hypothetical protein
LKHFPAVAFGVFDVLNAIAGFAKDPLQRFLALDKRLTRLRA